MLFHLSNKTSKQVLLGSIFVCKWYYGVKLFQAKFFSRSPMFYYWLNLLCQVELIMFFPTKNVLVSNYPIKYKK